MPGSGKSRERLTADAGNNTTQGRVAEAASVISYLSAVFGPGDEILDRHEVQNSFLRDLCLDGRCQGEFHKSELVRAMSIGAQGNPNPRGPCESQ